MEGRRRQAAKADGSQSGSHEGGCGTGSHGPTSEAWRPACARAGCRLDVWCPRRRGCRPHGRCPGGRWAGMDHGAGWCRACLFSQPAIEVEQAGRLLALGRRCGKVIRVNRPAAHGTAIRAQPLGGEQARTCVHRGSRDCHGGIGAGRENGQEVRRQGMPAEVDQVEMGGHRLPPFAQALAGAREGVAAQASAHQRGSLDGRRHNPSKGPARTTTAAGGMRLLSPSGNWLLDRGVMGSLTLVTDPAGAGCGIYPGAQQMPRVQDEAALYPHRYERNPKNKP